MAKFGLPKQLEENLLLRWAEPDDTEALAEFNFQMHNDSPDEPETWLKDWTLALMSGRHPTTGPSDFTVVVDEADGGRIISSAVSISQTWAYDGVPFDVGRPELIGTDDKWRQRGLVREQMDALHALSQSKGELVQVITGIPWFYRQFGYEMALEYWGSRGLPFSKIKPLKDDAEEKYRLRPVEAADQPVLQELYQLHCQQSLISCLRDDQIWRYELSTWQGRSALSALYIIEETGGSKTSVGMVSFPNPEQRPMIRELTVFPDYNLREVALFIARQIQSEWTTDEKKISLKKDELRFAFGSSHPVYKALEPDLGPLTQPYAFYMRVPQLDQFLMHIKTVLEKRLASSPMTGFDGKLKLNFFTNHWQLTFDHGKIAAVSAYKPEKFFDGDAYFPERIFLQLLFGYRSLEELKYAFTECSSGNAETTVLLESLFPKSHSQVVALE